MESQLWDFINIKYRYTNGVCCMTFAQQLPGIAPSDFREDTKYSTRKMYSVTGFDTTSRFLQISYAFFGLDGL